MRHSLTFLNKPSGHIVEISDNMCRVVWKKEEYRIELETVLNFVRLGVLKIEPKIDNEQMKLIL